MYVHDGKQEKESETLTQQLPNPKICQIAMFLSHWKHDSAGDGRGWSRKF
jgi:hypothetical protein